MSRALLILTMLLALGGCAAVRDVASCATHLGVCN